MVMVMHPASRDAKQADGFNGKKHRHYSPVDRIIARESGEGETSAANENSQLRKKNSRLTPPSIGSICDLAREIDPSSSNYVYSPVAADLLADVATWSYADSVTLMDELLHRDIIHEDATCQEVSVANYPMLVVSTAFFIRCGKVGVLAFRGTDPMNVINFLTDANTQTSNLLSLGLVHGGFSRNVRAVWYDIYSHVQSAIDDEENPLEALYITGHSLGGAMALLAGAIVFGDPECMSWRKLLQGVYTYGQPMVGDAEFARVCDERFGNRVFRHVYDHDLVPRLPPESTGGFVHFGREYIGNDDGWTPRSSFVTQAKTIALSVPIAALAFAVKQLPLLSWLRLPYSIDDHSPNAYLRAFRAARP